MKLLLFTVADDRQLILIGIHTDPDEAVEEIDALMDVHSAVKRKWGTDDILILGDLNADCNYASNRARGRLRLRTDSRFDWLIDDDVDTTTTRTDCTYDRCSHVLFNYALMCVFIAISLYYFTILY